MKDGLTTKIQPNINIDFYVDQLARLSMGATWLRNEEIVMNSLYAIWKVESNIMRIHNVSIPHRGVNTSCGTVGLIFLYGK